ncbi:MAG: MBL fold metallo-hydrolase [Candidatus Sungbacteria bacterium]|uniref:MBL fold metallo-hydrolase n=1 Tax=Candidatus Sungiibacteriota bacterium TaxID=2750080 RepID=A0A9D6QVR7_9BACT|nr:MBL fold metallo-hydrolase [Candidatus Sungbacteria bacterium]
MKIKLSFHGGAQSVTGACYLVEINDDTQIVVDCGLEQGGRFCESKNSKPFDFDVAKVSALFITHAHLDHVGRIPKLIKEGYRGPIYSTPPTKDLGELIIRDGLGIMQHEAEYCHEEPAYEINHIDQAMRQWQTLLYHTPIEIGPAKITLLRAGHILGSSMVLIEAEGKKILFTGDLGSDHSKLLPPADKLWDIDYLIIESVYGNKVHPDLAEHNLVLERAMEDNAAARGTLMIPAFATERTQDIIYEMNTNVVEHRVPDMPVFVDSPLAIKVTEVFEKYYDYYSDEIKVLHKQHPHLFTFKALHFTPSVEESKAINDVPQPKVIIAGSGMMTGGRILHHLKRYLPDPHSSLMIAGYQAAGSLGRKILDGAQEIKIYGETVPVRARIILAFGYSAHADKNRLFEFVSGMKGSLKWVFAVQGEPEASLAFAQNVKDRLGIRADAPRMGDSVELV